MPDGIPSPRPGFSANSASRVRHHNRRVLLHALRLEGSLSRAELARATGLTPQAIANIVDDLIGAGLVREAGRRKAKRGQPPIEIEIAKDGGYALGIRIDSSHFHAAAADLGGDIIETREGPAPAQGDWLDFLSALYADFAGRFGAERCLGLGLVTPGPFDVTWPGVPTPGAVPALQSRAIAEALADKTGTDVLLENDATAAALGEKLYGEALSLNDFFYVFIGEGVGGGIVIRGEPYRGNRGNAGEFGHAVIDPNGPSCYCGNRGCLGEYLSLSAMRRDLALAEAQGKDATAARDAWIRRAAEALSIGLTTIENLFDPERIILGGAAPVALLEELARHLRLLRPSVRQDFGDDRLRLSQLGERSAALGASALPILAATTSGPA
ncbi:ROK family transcriptional regulator [Taklimakanibacter deserti]|uniref:ROK family transcriptional regulator n=1 Tax=Taklimakanibacter deserti TaxID=2267839 RepID=UPI000E65B716